MEVDGTLEEHESEEFDALMLPGAVMNPDQLRMDLGAVTFVRNFFEENRPVAAICHAPWLLDEADVAKGRRLNVAVVAVSTMTLAVSIFLDRSKVTVDDSFMASPAPSGST